MKIKVGAAVDLKLLCPIKILFEYLIFSIRVGVATARLLVSTANSYLSCFSFRL